MLWLRHLQLRSIEATLLLAFFWVCQRRSHVSESRARLRHSCFDAVCCCLQVFSALYRSFRRLWLDISAFSCRGRYGKSFVSSFFQQKHPKFNSLCKIWVANRTTENLRSVTVQKIHKLWSEGTKFPIYDSPVNFCSNLETRTRTIIFEFNKNVRVVCTKEILARVLATKNINYSFGNSSNFVTVKGIVATG